MKTPTFLHLLSLSLVQAATLNVGSGQTYSTVSSNRFLPSPKHKNQKLSKTRSQQHTTPQQRAIPSTSTPVPTKKSSPSPRAPSRSKAPHTPPQTPQTMTLSSPTLPMLLLWDLMMLLVAPHFLRPLSSILKGRDTDKIATLLVSGTGFKMYNMNVTNSAVTASQAVALSATGTNQGFYASAFKGWQDTLYAHTGSQFFGRCYVEVSSLLSF